MEYYKDNLVTIYKGDCREVILEKVSAVVTDPPYELGFMGKGWDKRGVSFQRETWEKIRSYCLPGAMLLSFGGTRTLHRIACAIEDAGWQIRDTLQYFYDNSYQIHRFLESLTQEQLELLDKAFPSDGLLAWNYGTGFPKNLDIGKSIDKQAGARREAIEVREDFAKRVVNPRKGSNGQSRLYGVDKRLGEEAYSITAPATPEAKLWEGYGTALKPAYESITLAMSPLDGTFANNALKHRVAGLNIDACRIEHNDSDLQCQTGHKGQPFGSREHNFTPREYTNRGRFPANFIHDGSQEVMELFPDTNTHSTGKTSPSSYKTKSVFGAGYKSGAQSYGSDSGSAARYFYCAKASRRERDAGLEDMDVKYKGRYRCTQGRESYGRNNHPAVKPLALMTYLCKLVKMPEYNLILDSFCGSGTTLLACKKLGIPCIGIDSEEKYCEIAAKRVQRCQSL